MLTTLFLVIPLALLAALLWWRRRAPRRGAGASGSPAAQVASARESRRTVSPAVVTGESAPIPPELSSLSLRGEDTLDEQDRALLERVCAEMGEPHPVQRQLASGLDDPEDLIEVVSSDAGISADVLRTVNSAAFALMEPITSVPQAVNYLGVNIVKGLVLRVTLRQSARAAEPAQEQALTHVWQSALATSAMARLLALELGRPRPSVLGTQALFLNIGDVALLRSVAGADAWYRQGTVPVERIRQQQEECGLNAAIVGAAVVRRWGLPEGIGDAIARGWLPLGTGPGQHPLRGEAREDNVLLYLASRIGDRLAYHGLRDIAELDLTPGTDPSLYWLGAHLHAARLGRVTELVYTPGFCRKANRVLATFAARGQGA